jgi:hypothetical protein
MAGLLQATSLHDVHVIPNYQLGHVLKELEYGGIMP